MNGSLAPSLGVALVVLLAPAIAPGQTAHLAITSITDEMGGFPADRPLPPTPITARHTFVVTNFGPGPVAGARITDVASEVQFGGSWTCVPSGGATCSAGQGTQVVTQASLPAGSSITYTVGQIYDCCSPPPLVIYTARIDPPAGTVDPNPANNIRSLYSYWVPTVGGTRYFTVTPCRLVDTRPAGAAFRSGEVRNYQVAQLCGVPTTAAAVALNVTAVQPTDSGNLRVYPLGRGTGSSALNFAPGRNRANNAIVRLGQEGIGVHADLMPTSLGTVHLVIDVYGYFAVSLADATTPVGPTAEVEAVPARPTAPR